MNLRIEAVPGLRASVRASQAIQRLPFEVSGPFVHEVVEQSPYARMVADLSKRLQFLKVEAEIDGIPFSLASCGDFLDFMRDVQPQARPSLFLNDNGNLRTLWRNNEHEQIGLQFLGGGNIQFIIFKRRPEADLMTRVTGVDAKANIIAHIKASGALGLLAA